MNNKKKLNIRDERRKTRTRAKLFGTAERPRISIFKSNTHTYVQVINDVEQKTIAQSSTLTDMKGVSHKKSDVIKKISESLSSKMKEKKITSAILDRGPYQYHGFVKELTDEIRKKGIKI